MAKSPRRRAVSPPPAVLPPVLDLRAAAPLAADLLGRRGKPLVIDAAAVERMGGLCLQVLLSARNTWAADGQAFRIQAASTAFTDSLGALGAADLASSYAGEFIS